MNHARAYYNEHDRYAAEWLRNLIAAGHLPAGDVDERSIADVQAAELAGYTSCHFFAGIGGWPLALRLAGWPDDRPVWTGSCPCQPFSAAGKRKGTADERHLWPEFRRLIAECLPPVVLGEQVASKDGRLWLAGVRADLEALGYACGAADLCAAGVGAPHIRQRLFWVADAGHDDGAAWSARRQQQSEPPVGQGAGGDSAARRLADADGWFSGHRDVQPGGEHGQQPEDGRAGRLGHADALGLQGRANRSVDPEGWEAAQRPARLPSGWADADWLPCTDGKARRVEPGTFPLAHGVPNRVGRLRAYGNAIVPQVAAEFIAAWLDCRPERRSMTDLAAYRAICAAKRPAPLEYGLARPRKAQLPLGLAGRAA